MQLFRVFADTAAGTAHGESRAHNNGIADNIGKRHGGIQVLHHLGGNAGLVQLFHGILKQLAVLGTVNGVRLAGQQAHAAAVQKAAAGQFHGKVQAHLAAQIGQNGVRLFLFNNAFHNFGGQRLNINMIRNIRVRHDGGRVGVDQHGLNTLGFQSTAGLRAGVVKLGSLTDDDRAGTDNQHLFDSRIFRHLNGPLSRG